MVKNDWHMKLNEQEIGTNFEFKEIGTHSSYISGVQFLLTAKTTSVTPK